jgi:LacI family transcriptional regulator
VASLCVNRHFSVYQLAHREPKHRLTRFSRFLEDARTDLPLRRIARPEEYALAASIRDVAEHAGVSVGTVSNVLNRPEVVSAGTRERVLTAISALGFVRNESARQLRAGHSRTIGLVVLDIANPFFTDVARGVEDTANAEGLSVILCNSDDLAQKEAAHLDVLAEQRVQGVLITPTTEISPAVEALRARGVPVVLLDRRATGPDQCSVAVDDVHGGRLAADHLLERGHRRIAFVGGHSTLPQVVERFTGVTAAVREVLGTDESLTVLEQEELTFTGGRRAGERIVGMTAATRPTAAVCANDLVALGLLQEMVRHGVRVPDEFAIVGYDDIDFAAAAAVPLSSVRKPRQELGRRAAELLLDEARNTDHLHEQLVFEPTLVVRESSMVRRSSALQEGTA